MLLGLLLQEPSHGYDLSRRFDRSSALGDILRLTASHLYALLAHLEREGAIAGEQQASGARPQRRVYHLTDSGRQALFHWISLPVDHPRDMRIEFPLKLYLAHLHDRSVAHALITDQRKALQSYIERLESAPSPQGTPFDIAFVALMRSGRIGRARAALDWLDMGEAVISQT